MRLIFGLCCLLMAFCLSQSTVQAVITEGNCGKSKLNPKKSGSSKKKPTPGNGPLQLSTGRHRADKRTCYDATFYMKYALSFPLAGHCRILSMDDPAFLARKHACSSECHRAESDKQLVKEQYDKKLRGYMGCFRRAADVDEDYTIESTATIQAGSLCFVTCTCTMLIRVHRIWMPRAWNRTDHSVFEEFSPNTPLADWIREKDSQWRLQPKSCHPEYILKTFPDMSNSLFSRPWIVDSKYDIHGENLDCKLKRPDHLRMCRCPKFCPYMRKNHVLQSTCPSDWRFILGHSEPAFITQGARAEDQRCCGKEQIYVCRSSSTTNDAVGGSAASSDVQPINSMEDMAGCMPLNFTTNCIDHLQGQAGSLPPEQWTDCVEYMNDMTAGVCLSLRELTDCVNFMNEERSSPHHSSGNGALPSTSHSSTSTQNAPAAEEDISIHYC
ncbi:hypothetical protein BCR37DRAFT_389879 [Protomyces lactucae-debilis]|uniref:Extracellular membrane protein CFEM domain-containing protein n=1 Tax=Protomyces lactucae-debilis TaxID=2754530 RepID=A0A1Y2ETX3_PROLT|nr:uncharacterized protein BCR37DRAFT_389879 [Protomyces lactucae-debilis]ORY74626.1 hypothetical protein BCR37DRAFT_389879 [Protomyces lactucae-debilis]